MGFGPRQRIRLQLAGLAFAVTVSACADARSVEAGPARRVVSLIPAATEILFALGSGDRVVGRTRWGVYPPEARAIADLGDGVQPSLELILSVDPDLVVLFEGPDNEGVAARLAELGIRTLMLRHNSFADLERNVRALGDAVGCSEAAEALVAAIDDEIAVVAEAVSGRERVRAYYDVWSEPPMTIGAGSYLDSLMTLAGAKNIFGDLAMPAPEVGLESIVARDPDVVVHAVSRAPDAREDPPGQRVGWGHVRAIAEDRVVIVDADLLGRLGPRVGDAARHLAAALHPGVSFPRHDVRIASVVGACPR